jgi:hypothetical protein
VSKRIEEIRWVLVDLIYDFCGSAEIYREYSRKKDFDPHNDMRSLAIVRVCQTSAIIGLSKYWELTNGYGKEINLMPESLRSKIIALKVEIENKKIYQFRSKYIGHVFDDDTRAPINLSDGDPRLEKIVGTGWDQFYEWVFPGPEADLSNSVVGCITEFRDYCNGILGAGKRP